MVCPKNEAERRDMEQGPYQTAIGSLLLYAEQTTHPDIAFAMGKLSKFNLNPGRKHWIGVKRIMRYLLGTSSLTLIYSEDENKRVYRYVNVDYTDDQDDRKSVSGYALKLGNGANS